MACSTIFSGFNQTVENRALLLIIKDIKEGKYRADIEPIRSLIASGDTEKADQLKRQLPAFTPSATFKGGRKADLLNQYSGYVHLDFDKLTSDQLNTAFQAITQIPFTFACFRSPSGKGLKVFVEVNTGSEHHDFAYKQVQAYYEKALGIPCDPKCKDITRLCFVSDDPDTYKNIHNQKFEVQTVFNESVVKQKYNTIPDFQTLFEDCIRFTEQKEQYHSGNRNNFVYLLACNCNRKGIPENTALDFISTNFDLSEQEIRASVKSAYNHHFNEFANFAKSAKVQTNTNEQKQQQETIEEDYLKNTPTIPDEVYNQLPDLIKSGALAFTDLRERDVFLTGAFAILSGCLPNVKGVYAQQIVYPNLFAFVIAPAASGKGALKFSKTLADKHHDQLLKSSKEEQQRYDSEMNEYKTRQRAKKKHEPAEEPPEQPPFRVVFIPANSSYAKILSHLEQNQGEGIICETEADTMGNVLKQEWGGYSDMLRKAFHHERISSSKKTNNEYIEVNEPRLSVALSGTPSQVTGLIASAEDGLFSRFMFYAYKVEQQWRDVSPYASSINLTEHFNTLSDQVFQLIQFLKHYPTSVELTQQQWQTLNRICSRWLIEVTTFTGDDAGSIVKRLGLVLYRLTMIFTALRKFEIGDTSTTVFCNDSDFDTAVNLADLYLQHSLLMFYNLPKQNDNAVFRSGDNKRKFFDALPPDFKRAEAIELGKKFNLSTRSVDNLLKELTGIYLTQPQYGCYSKQ
ncbi:MAG: DUF3987 domain-containing protein [Bacteroidales bacterium]|jgi:hypothetical protein|nr:DUF3987 domain-containing protein [Bacteroidales bacterium]